MGLHSKTDLHHGALTWVAMYAIDAGVTEVMPWIRALPDRVALATLSTELGDVKTCLYALHDANISVRYITWRIN